MVFACAVDLRQVPAVVFRDAVAHVHMAIVKMNQKCIAGGKAVNPVEYDRARKENFR